MMVLINLMEAGVDPEPRLRDSEFRKRSMTLGSEGKKDAANPRMASAESSSDSLDEGWSEAQHKTPIARDVMRKGLFTPLVKDPLQDTRRTLKALDAQVSAAEPVEQPLLPSGRPSSKPRAEESKIPTASMRLGSEAAESSSQPPLAFAPTVEARKISIRPTSDKSIKLRKGGSTARRVEQGPSNLTLAVLWTVALVSIGLAIFFFATR
jgi:hypothetical protein